MAAPPGDSTGDLADVEAKFAEFLRLRERGDPVTLEELCARFPDQEVALRVLHSIYEQGKSAVEPASLAERLERHFGAEVIESGSLDTEVFRPAGVAAGTVGVPAPGKRGEPRYSVRGEVARGGMGVVYRVWDRDLNRTLAMKVLQIPAGRAGPGKTPPELLARFLEEAQVTAQLDHPGIVPVHELGIDAEERVFFTMHLVKGRELKEIFALAREGREGWNLPRAVGVMVKACQAVAYAHAKGVVHRDLKPANVMVGRFGEVFIMDWGLAKVLGQRVIFDLRPRGEEAVTSLTTVHSVQRAPGGEGPESPLITLDGTVIGTPAYMSPEQAAGKVDEVDHATDVYALGAILYTLLAGHPPYVPPGVNISARTILARVLDGPPAALHEVSPRAPAELAAVCEKAMARARERRYGSCLDMAEDLQAYLDGRVVKAYETGAAAEFRKWVRRNKGTAAAVAAAGVLLIAGLLGVALVQAAANRSLRAERDRVLRLADIKRLKDYVGEADSLWPCVPEKAGAMSGWLAGAEDLVRRTGEHRAALDGLRRQAVRAEAAAPADEKGPAPAAGWSLPTPELQWQHDVLAELVAGLEVLADPDPLRGAVASVRRRLEFARTVRQRTVEDPASVWERAARSIADAGECPAYGGLRIRPQLGLVPLGRDPGSGLWEFGHLETGAIPGRDASGRLEVGAGTGLVFVLIPGGTLRMGAVLPSAAQLAGAPNVDPEAEKNEAPVHEVALAPFLASKFEMTQGQWARFTGGNPSAFRAGSRRFGTDLTELHPVENVSLEECRAVIGRLGLDLPTEAQWEYMARAGTSTVWWTGNEETSIRGAANLADRSLQQHAKDWFYEDWLEDGHAAHGPVGSYRANAFGLHDVMGNVWEWVREGFSPYTEPPRAGDGERSAPAGKPGICRGGGWNNTAESVRSANRFSYPRDNRTNDLGVRPVRRVE